MASSNFQRGVKAAAADRDQTRAGEVRRNTIWQLRGKTCEVKMWYNMSSWCYTMFHLTIAHVTSSTCSQVLKSPSIVWKIQSKKTKNKENDGFSLWGEVACWNWLKSAFNMFSFLFNRQISKLFWDFWPLCLVWRPIFFNYLVGINKLDFYWLDF